MWGCEKKQNPRPLPSEGFAQYEPTESYWDFEKWRGTAKEPLARTPQRRGEC